MEMNSDGEAIAEHNKIGKRKWEEMKGGIKKTFERMNEIERA